MVFQCHLPNMKYERLPDMFLGRTSFAAHYDFEDRFIYVIGGNIVDDGQSSDECEKFDVYNLTWSPMPRLNERRSNPGTFISNDKEHLYVFFGFRQGQGQFNDKIVSHIERLALKSEEATWEAIQVKNDIKLEMGSFIMYSLDKLLRQAAVWKRDAAKAGVNLEIFDSDLLESANARNKVLLIGGWRPFENLSNFKVFDLKTKEIKNFSDDPLSKIFPVLEQDDPSAFDIEGEEEEELEMMEIQDQKNQIDSRLVMGDKFTKQPVWYGHRLILLGRSHLQCWNIKTGRFTCIHNHGEDFAESHGKKNPCCS